MSNSIVELDMSNFIPQKFAAKDDRPRISFSKDGTILLLGEAEKLTGLQCGNGFTFLLDYEKKTVYIKPDEKSPITLGRLIKSHSKKEYYLGCKNPKLAMTIRNFIGITHENAFRFLIDKAVEIEGSLIFPLIHI